MSVERKLTTILCADVAGYTRLMDEDEVRTLERLKQHRDALASLIGRHRGRVINTWGDGLIADFPSVVEAVLCSVEAQRELRARNEALATGERLEFRICINLGDVMVEGSDLYGEGVNVASRLQALAEPGGIVISGTVHDQVRDKLTVAYEFAGARQMKNMAEAIPVFRVKLDAGGKGPGRSDASRQAGATAAAPTTDGPATRQRRPLGRWLYVPLVLILFFFLVNLFTGMADGTGEIWFQWPSLVIGLVVAMRWAWTR
jgi:adenylate cyclase